MELRGFEPLTPSMRTRCATGLRYSPWNASQRSKCRGFLLTGNRGAGGRAQLTVARLAVSSVRRARTDGHSEAVMEYLAESRG